MLQEIYHFFDTGIFTVFLQGFDSTNMQLMIQAYGFVFLHELCQEISSQAPL